MATRQPNDAAAWRARAFPCLAALLTGALIASSAASAQDANGRVIRVSEDAFTGSAGRISFSEFPLNTSNPVYPPQKYGAGADGVEVRFGGFFRGQRLGTRATCPPGGALTGCVVGDPSSGLTLDSSSPQTFIAEDSSNPHSPGLSGSPRWEGPISIRFDRDVAGVGLIGGFFDGAKSTAITAFDRQGRKIGSVANRGTGMEFLGLMAEGGAEIIAGLQFSIVGEEPAGFGIDEVRFAERQDLNPEDNTVRDGLATKPAPDLSLSDESGG